jgi:quinol monooxygenase YgiN
MAVLKSTPAYSQNNIIVLVKYKSLPAKDSLALAALSDLVAKVKNEPNYVNIIVHVDPVDKTNILLYEQWSNEDYYKGDHLKTPYLQKFINDSRSFLAGPPEITFWKIKN